MAVLAQILGYSIGQVAIGLIILVAVVAVFYAYAQASGVAIPPLVVRIFWIVLGAALAIIAIRLLLSL